MFQLFADICPEALGRMLADTFEKFNGNNGYVNEEEDASVAGLAAAFSHYTFDHTDGQELCLDIQGVARQWTDPQLRSRNKRFGPADLGEQGMGCFFHTHT